MSGVHSGFEQFALLAHIPEGFQRNIVVQIAALHTHGRIGGVAGQLLEGAGFFHHQTGDLPLAGAGGTHQHHDTRLLHSGCAGPGIIAVSDDLHHLEELVIGVHRQHAGGFLIPGAAHQNGVSRIGSGNIVHTIIKEDIHIDLILAGSHVDVILRDLRKQFPDPLGADAHKLRIHRGRHEHLGHFTKLFHELLGALDGRLGAEKFRVMEEFKDHIRAGAKLAPTVHLVDGDRRIKFVFFVSQTDRVGDALHQHIINIQRSGKRKFPIHIHTSCSLVFAPCGAQFS